MQQHPTLLKVTSQLSVGGQSKRTQDCKNSCVKLNQLYMPWGSPLFLIFLSLSCSLHCHPPAACTVILLLLALSSPNLSLPHNLTPITGTIITILAIRYSFILSSVQTISVLSDPLYLSTPFLF